MCCVSSGYCQATNRQEDYLFGGESPVVISIPSLKETKRLEPNALLIPSPYEGIRRKIIKELSESFFKT